MTAAGGDRRVLVTGASGLIGLHVLPALRAKGFEVHGVARHHSPSDAGDVTWHELDLSDHAGVERSVASIRPSHLLHLAWDIHGDYYDSPENIRWLGDSLHVVQAFIERGGRRLVAAGTSVEYDFRGDADLSEGSTPLRPDGLYGECKKALSEVAGFYASRRSVSFAWGRVFFCYGPGERAYRMIPSLLDAIERQDRVPFHEGRGLRDYVYVSDVAEAFATLMESRVEGALNIGSGSPISLRAFVSKLADAAGRPGSIDFGAVPAPSYEPSRVVADISRIRSETGWRPRWTVDDGIRETVAWWRSLRRPAGTAASGARSRK